MLRERIIVSRLSKFFDKSKGNLLNLLNLLTKMSVWLVYNLRRMTCFFHQFQCTFLMVFFR